MLIILLGILQECQGSYKYFIKNDNRVFCTKEKSTIFKEGDIMIFWLTAKMTWLILILVNKYWHKFFNECNQALVGYQKPHDLFGNFIIKAWLAPLWHLHSFYDKFQSLSGIMQLEYVRIDTYLSLLYHEHISFTTGLENELLNANHLLIASSHKFNFDARCLKLLHQVCWEADLSSMLYPASSHNYSESCCYQLCRSIESRHWKYHHSKAWTWNRYSC